MASVGYRTNVIIILLQAPHQDAFPFTKEIKTFLVFLGFGFGMLKPIGFAGLLEAPDTPAEVSCRASTTSFLSSKLLPWNSHPYSIHQDTIKRSDGFINNKAMETGTLQGLRDYMGGLFACFSHASCLLTFITSPFVPRDNND